MESINMRLLLAIVKRNIEPRKWLRVSFATIEELFFKGNA